MRIIDWSSDVCSSDLLFVDTFKGTFECENAVAALRVLQAAGYTVHSVAKDDGHYCCGRTYLAGGMVEEAKAKAGALIDALLPLAEAGVAVVGLEPSCLQVGRASCRDRVCQYVYISVVAVSLKKKPIQTKYYI